MWKNPFFGFRLERDSKDRTIEADFSKAGFQRTKQKTHNQYFSAWGISAGGESRRINWATSIGSSLVGSIYVLDEPSIGLHPLDNVRLINIFKRLRDIGNTVLVVEHDADQIIDMGTKAGERGGEGKNLCKIFVKLIL